MSAYRFAYRLVFGLSRWFAVAFAALALSACGATGMTLTATITAQLPTAHTTARPIPTAIPTTAFTPSTANDWNTYRNDRAGYTIDYPATWRFDERVDVDGANVTTFSPTSGNSGVSVAVIVRNSEPADQQIPDMPNTRCQQVTIGSLAGRRCFDTLAFSISTTLADHGKQYTIAASGKHLDQNIYQRFLQSFAVTA